MNSEIRASSALTATMTPTGSSELSIQNPLFSIGGQDAFPQLLKQHIQQRDDVKGDSRPQVSHHAARKPSSARHEKAAAHDEGGNRLPTRTDKPVSKHSERHRDDSDGRCSQTEASAAQESANPNAIEDTVPADSAVAQEAPVEAVSEPVAGPALTDVEAAEPSVELALDAVVEEQTMPLQDFTDGSAESADDQIVVAVAEGAGLDASATAEAAQLSSRAELEAEIDVADVSGLAEMVATTESTGDSLPEADAAEIDQSDADPDVSQVGAASAVMTGITLPASSSPQEQDTASPLQETVREVVSSVATAMSDTMGEEQDSSEQTAGEMADWELGPDKTPAEKNAEVRAEQTKMAPVTPDKNAQFKDQLAALAQQMSGNRDGAKESANTRKTESLQDVKAAAFSRTLEQFTSNRTDSAKPVSTGIQTPLMSRQWAGELGQRLVMMISSKIKSAEIHLNPKDLGPVEVRIRMQEEKAHVVFTSHILQTREALEQAVPRLRDMLDQNGVALGNVDVQDRGTQQSHQQENQGEGGKSRGNSGRDAVEDIADNEGAVVRPLGLVDYYA